MFKLYQILINDEWQSYYWKFPMKCIDSTSTKPTWTTASSTNCIQTHNLFFNWNFLSSYNFRRRWTKFIRNIFWRNSSGQRKVEESVHSETKKKRPQSVEPWLQWPVDIKGEWSYKLCLCEKATIEERVRRGGKSPLA